MRKVGILFLIAVFLSGCATYKYHHGKEPYNKGYVVSREDYAIVEYTLGQDNTVPKLDLAKERFKRRRDTVENYYKRMGYIENRAKMIFWDPGAMFLKLVGGIFCLPFIAVSEFRYTHNPEYKARIDKMDADKDAREAVRIKELKDKLAVYVQQDLEKEASTPGKPVAGKKRPVKVKRKVALPAKQAEIKEEPVVQEADQKQISDISKDVIKEKTRAQKIESPKTPGQPVAVIVADPVKGYSPLRVRFYAFRSYVSKGRRIISYLWDFGDGDTSSKENAVNTYYSVNLMPRDFTVTLTVQDDAGNTASAATTIQVLNK